MIHLWVILAVLAGALQSLRTAMQHALRGQLSLNAAALVRHLFGLPYVLSFTAAYTVCTGHIWQGVVPGFAMMVAVAATLQLIGTLFLIHSFSDRGYLVGSAFAKTEAIQAAIFAALLFEERLGAATWCGILLSVFGIMVVALHGHVGSTREIRRAMVQPAAAFGMGAAGLLAATGLVGKRATAMVHTSDPIVAALVTVAAVMAVQVILQGIWMALRRPQELRETFANWRASARVGAVSAAGSIAWFAAIALAPVALVRIAGQTEAVFTIGLSRKMLGERPHRHEIFGLVLVALGVLVALWGSGQR